MNHFFKLKRVPLSILCTFALALVCLCGCEQKKPKAPPPPPKVTVAKAVVRDVTNYVYFTGYTEAKESVNLRARVEGFLLNYSFAPGDMVKKGDLLFEIDPKPFAAEVNQAQANLEIQQAARELAEATLKRNESAFKEHAVSELTVLEAQAEYSEALAEVKGAQAALVKDQLDLSYTKVYAPVDGRISRNLVDVGNLVGGQGEKTLLATLVNYNPVYVYFNVDERTLMLFKKHNPQLGQYLKKAKKTPVFLALEGDNGYPRAGVAEYLDTKVDLATGTIQVRSIFPNQDLFILPGQFARVRVPYQIVKGALLVPDVALSSDQRGSFLLVVNSKNIVEDRPVETDTLINGLRVITKGITAEDRVIVKGIQRARPGAPVTPVEKVSENAKQPPAKNGEKKAQAAK